MTVCDLRIEGVVGVVETSQALLGRAGSHSWISTSCSRLKLVKYHHCGPETISK